MYLLGYALLGVRNSDRDIWPVLGVIRSKDVVNKGLEPCARAMVV